MTGIPSRVSGVPPAPLRAPGPEYSAALALRLMPAKTGASGHADPTLPTFPAPLRPGPKAAHLQLPAGRVVPD